MKKVTITDVAQEAGVSVAAVSRYINKSGYVSKEKQKVIKQAIDQVGYSLVKSKVKDSDLMGIICPSPRDSVFFQKMISALVERGKYIGKNLVLICEDNYISNRKLPEDIQEAMKYPLDGLIVAGMLEKKISTENNQLLQNLPIPVVMLERTGQCRSISSITFDDFSGIKDVVEYLYDLGHREIAYIGCAKPTEVESNRYNGFLEAIRELGVPQNNQRVVLKEYYDIEQGRSAMQKLLKNQPEITAVVTGADGYAMGAIQAIKENNLSVPEDISVVGFDDSYAELCFPKLTSVEFPMEEAANEIFNVLADEKKMKTNMTPRHIKLGLRLVLRESTKRQI